MTDPEADFEDEFVDVESADGTPTMMPVQGKSSAGVPVAQEERTYEDGETPFLPF